MSKTVRIGTLLCLLSSPGCLQFFPEASLRGDVPLSEEQARVERAIGIRFTTDVVREQRSANEIFPLARATVFERAAGDQLAFEQRVFEMFRTTLSDPPPSARALTAGTRDAGYAYDPASERIYVPDSGAETLDPRTARRADLARTDALARALLAQNTDRKALAQPKRDGFNRDAADAVIGSIMGAAHAGVLEASLGPTSGLDAGEQSIRRYHAALTQRLLADPDGAPARELARVDLPDAERRALESLLEVEGLDRRRRILRQFAAANLYLEARDRVTFGNLPTVYSNPPKSSEQLLHPERYLDIDDPPIRIVEGRRAGLLGIIYMMESTSIAGEFGVLNALEGVLSPGEASDAAAGWGGDLLTVFRHRESGELAYAWRIECDHRFAARRLCAGLERAVQIRFGGEWVELDDGVMELQGGAAPCRILRRDPSIAFVLGGRTELQRNALDLLLAEVAKPEPSTTKAKGHDPLYRFLRAGASPFFFDSPGRFDSRAYSLYGWLFRHRRADLDGEFEAFNWSEFPFADRLLPVDMYGMLFSWERGDHRRDLTFFQKSIRSARDLDRSKSRFWSPFVSWIRSEEYSQTGVGYGMFFEMGEGAGREELSPRFAYSYATELDGAKTRYGALFDAVSYGSREGSGKRFELFPYGALFDFESQLDPNGFSTGLFLDAFRLRRAETHADAASLDLSFFWDRGARFFHDSASGSREFSFIQGHFFGHFGSPRRHATGLGRFGDRWFFGFGGEDGRGFFDCLWFRFGG